jgi:hypothetical protein
MTLREANMYCPIAKQECKSGQIVGSVAQCRFWGGHECVIYIYLITLASQNSS